MSRSLPVIRSLRSRSLSDPVPWLEGRTRDEKMRSLCAQESVVLTMWGPPDSSREEDRIYYLPGDEGSVRFRCRDEDPNVCDLIQVEWWQD